MLAAAWLASPATAAEPTFPSLTGPVVDAAGILDPGVESELAARLASYQKTSGHQLVAATVPSLEGYEIRDYGNRLFRTWQLGDKQRNDGVLLLVAPNDRKVSIEVGYGLEGTLTDAYTRLVIENSILPRFRSGDFGSGIREGVDGIIRIANGDGETVARELSQQEEPDISDIIFAVFVMFIIFIIVTRILRGRRILNAGPGGTTWSSGSSGGFGGGGFSGGGGYSGGGGSSGGGGASGSW